MTILTNALIAVAAVGVVGYALMSHLQSRGPRPRARTGGDGGADVVIAQHVTGTNDHGSGRPFSDAPSSIFKGPPGCKRKNWYFKLFQTGPETA